MPTDHPRRGGTIARWVRPRTVLSIVAAGVAWLLTASLVPPTPRGLWELAPAAVLVLAQVVLYAGLVLFGGARPVQAAGHAVRRQWRTQAIARLVPMARPISLGMCAGLWQAGLPVAHAALAVAVAAIVLRDRTVDTDANAIATTAAWNALVLRCRDQLTGADYRRAFQTIVGRDRATAAAVLRGSMSRAAAALTDADLASLLSLGDPELGLALLEVLSVRSAACGSLDGPPGAAWRRAAARA